MKPQGPITVQTGVWKFDPEKKQLIILPAVSPVRSTDFYFDRCLYDPAVYPNPKNGDPIVSVRATHLAGGACF
jgi:hypothetical protein